MSEVGFHQEPLLSSAVSGAEVQSDTWNENEIYQF